MFITQIIEGVMTESKTEPRWGDLELDATWEAILFLEKK